MDSQIDSTKEQLMSLFSQLQTECSIFERIVYKNKNQHRRSSYFQYLLKVRRNLKLLQYANLEELISSCCLVITGNRPKQKLHLLESLKRRKYEVGKANFMERLLGAARLLSQMVEPILQAAIEVSTLLARSFFMGFSLTVLSLLARIRVLIQQILLDIVTLFNIVSSLSQKKHTVKLNHGGIEVYREFYPKKEDYVTLECVWNTDKFELVEKVNKCEIEMQEGETGGGVSIRKNAVLYQSIESFLEDDEPTIGNVDIDKLAYGKNSTTNPLADPFIEDEDKRRVEYVSDKVDTTTTMTEALSKNTSEAPPADIGISVSSDSFKFKPTARKVAFVSVNRPASASVNKTGIPSKETRKSEVDKVDAFYNLLTQGSLKDSLFG